MITNERLKFLANKTNLERGCYGTRVQQDIIEALNELLALRKECQEWREDAERLVLNLLEHRDPFDKIVINQHNALVEKHKKA